MLPELLRTTGDQQCDVITRSLIADLEAAFPGRVRACYLRGSRASGSAVPGSDLDLFVVFRDRFIDRQEFDRARELTDRRARLSPVLLEAVLVGERMLQLPAGYSTALSLKLATRLLYGSELRDGLPTFDGDRYRRSVIHTPLNSYRVGRSARGPLDLPLRHLDPAGRFFGFDRWTTPGPDGVELPSTKLLVAVVGWTATAIVALHGGGYVRDKSESARLYRRVITDDWTDLVERTHELCRNRWRYRIPDATDDQHVLRALADGALEFQNHFLTLYRDALRTERDSTDPERRRLADRGLSQLKDRAE